MGYSSTIKSFHHNTSLDNACQNEPRLPLPMGKNSLISESILRGEFLKRRQTFHSPPRNDRASATAQRQTLDRMISQHRTRLTAGKSDFRLLPNQLGSAARVDLQQYHERTSTKVPFFFSQYATEKPSLKAVEGLAQNRRDYYAVRHVGKRGRDFITDEPIEGNDSKIGQLKTSPLLSSQSRETRAIRGFAATATIDQARGEYIARLHQHVVDVLAGEAGTVHIVRPARDPYVEDSTLNFFTFCVQTELATTLNTLEATSARLNKRKPIEFTGYKSLIGLSRTSRTEASPIGRLVQQPFFVTAEISAGDRIVIVDDHIQAGGSMLAMESAARGVGCNVLAFATLSSHPFSTQLSISTEVRNMLDDTLACWDPQCLVTNRLAKLGMPRDKLTNSEALILIAYATDPSNQGAIARFEVMQKRFFERAHLHNIGIDPDSPDTDAQVRELLRRQSEINTDSARSFVDNGKVLEGEHDSLIPVLRQMPKSPQDVVDELDKVSSTSRLSIEYFNVKQVIVLDWDDCLRDEKGLNYQLMHNALVLASKDNAKTMPELAEAVFRFQKRRQDKQPAKADDPILLKSQKDFSDYLMANPNIEKRHIVKDFVQTMLPDLRLDRVSAMTNVIYTQFRREYKRLLSPNQNSSATRDVPYPNIKFSLMPGAKELLDKCRTAESRVILISNRGQNDLQDEVNHLNMMHYFDVVSGVPMVTVPKLGPCPRMPEDSQRRLIKALQGNDDKVLREALEDASHFSHPDLTSVDSLDKKPSATRLNESLATLSIPSDVPVISYGDKPSDVGQLTELAGQGRRVAGVVVNPQNKDVGTQIDICGVPTRVVSHMAELSRGGPVCPGH